MTRPAHDEGTFIARIPRGIRSKEKLLRVLADKLHVPASFGGNWDALEECLRDLSWLTARRVQIQHADVPFGPGGDHRRVYLEILQSAARHWASTGERELCSEFPAEVEPSSGAATPQ